MSLNHREIDRILSELDLCGAQLQRIVQPAWDTVLLSFYKAGHSTQLLFCVAHGACRLHETSYRIPKTEKPQRFTELLRSRLRGHHLESIEQLGQERLVRLVFGSGDQTLRLYARLWSGAANLVLTDADDQIIDALARKPARGEISGGRFQIPDTLAPSGRLFEAREFPGEGSYNSRVDRFYATHGSELSREALLKKAEAWLDQRRAVLALRQSSLEDRARAYSDPDRYRELGDILMANIHREHDYGQTKSGRPYLECEDFYRGGEVRIPLDARHSLVDNARALYEKAKKARSGRQETALELALVSRSIGELDSLRGNIRNEPNPHLIRAMLNQWRQSAPRQERRFPGLSLERQGWLILVGRSSSENDQLLRRYVRGSDTWLHVRDFPGAYVFVKAKRDKSIPLPILLDAATLALYYSKARKNGQADLYYTRVKYLRRAKDGPKGLVIPTQEKNLHAKLDEARLRELRQLIGQDDES